MTSDSDRLALVTVVDVISPTIALKFARALLEL